MGRHLHAGIALLILGATAAAQDDRADKAAFQKVCGACHAITMVSDLKTEEEWVETVDHMASIGAKGTEQEFDGVLRHLARNFTKVNVNTATAAQIAPVLGLSAAAAQAVVDYRAVHGSFSTLADLRKVPGIDQAGLDARKDRIAFR
jgi:competence ComEA-like helix-hairpin-helix protein